MASIHGKEHPLRDIFSDQFAFTVPSFQRPYAWQIEHAEALINDLISFMQEAESAKELPPYFLGSIVLIKKEGLPEAEIVDGQQRLTTLTILLSALRELVPEKKRRNLTKFIYEEGNDFADTPNRYRLTLRELDAEFFQKHIQDDGGIKILKTLDPTALSESQKNIQANALLLLQRIEELNEEQRTRLAQAMILQCYLVEISTSDLDSAYNVFSILNDRGLNLSHADILKAQIIGKISSSQRSRYTAKWESAGELLKKRAFLNLFFHLDTIYRGNTDGSQEPFLARFRKHVYPTANPTLTPAQFIDKVLLPHAKALDTIANANYKCSKGAKEINNLLRWLYLPFRPEYHPQGAFPWIAAAMHFFTLHSNNPDLLLRFLADLECFEVVLSNSPYTPTTAKSRRERYSRLIDAIKLEEDLFAPESPLQITSAEKQSFLETLEGDIYHSSNPLYILLRLDNALAAADEPIYSYSTITIEHVLPQRPKANSDWRRWFPDETLRNDYTNCLGNLVLLSRAKNSEAQNFDFTVKNPRIANLVWR